MTRTCSIAIVSIALACAVAAAQPAADSIVTARQLYVDAAYDEALAMLDRLQASAAPDAFGLQREIQLTRAFCLLALGQEGDARKALERFVDLDPAFDLDEAEASPRVRDTLRAVRTERLPTIVQDRYVAAKQAFDSRDYATAATRFAQLRRLLADPVLSTSGAPGLSDLKTLVEGFADLSATLQPAAAASAQEPATTAAPRTTVQPATAGPGIESGASAPAGSEPGTTGVRASGPAQPVAAPATGMAPATAASAAGVPSTAGGAPGPRVVEPVPIDQPPPAPSAFLRQTYRATVIMVVDENGRVRSARVVESNNGLYDSVLLESFRHWRYYPGTQDGVATPFTRVLSVTVEPR